MQPKLFQAETGHSHLTRSNAAFVDRVHQQAVALEWTWKDSPGYLPYGEWYEISFLGRVAGLA